MLFAICANAGLVVFILSATVHMIRQRRQRREHPRDLVVSTRAGLAVGGMLLGLQAIIHPEVRHVIAGEQKEDSVDDGNGEEEPPGGRLFHQQLRRIRRGEEVDALTVRLDAAPDSSITPTHSTATSLPT
jgi:hypothetical protein